MNTKTIFKYFGIILLSVIVLALASYSSNMMLELMSSTTEGGVIIGAIGLLIVLLVLVLTYRFVISQIGRIYKKNDNKKKYEP